MHIKVSRAKTFEYLVAFERYPEFTESVRYVHREPEDEKPHLRFSHSTPAGAVTGTITVDIDADDYEVRWHSVEGLDHAGTIRLDEIGPHRCALRARINVRPQSIVGGIEAATGVVRRRFEHEIKQFGRHVERKEGRRPRTDASDPRAPSERLFDAVFPTDETTPGG